MPCLHPLALDFPFRMASDWKFALIHGCRTLQRSLSSSPEARPGFFRCSKAVGTCCVYTRPDVAALLARRSARRRAARLVVRPNLRSMEAWGNHGEHTSSATSGRDVAPFCAATATAATTAAAAAWRLCCHCWRQAGTAGMVSCRHFFSLGRPTAALYSILPLLSTSRTPTHCCLHTPSPPPSSHLCQPASPRSGAPVWPPLAAHCCVPAVPLLLPLPSAAHTGHPIGEGCSRPAAAMGPAGTAGAASAGGAAVEIHPQQLP